MKPQFNFTGILLMAVSLFSLNSHATTWTVSNNPDRPAQFTTIQAAVNEAALNDTILITGGTYAGFETVKPLVFYGEAVIASTGFPTTIINTASKLGRFNPTLSASGSRLYGIEFTSTLNIDGDFTTSIVTTETMSDIIIERCRFNFNGPTISLTINNGISDITIRNCLFSPGRISFSGGGSNLSNFIITNSIFSNQISSQGYISGSSGFNLQGNVVVRNCLFLNNTSAFTNTTQLILENNIFYRAEPTGCTQCTFNNNLTWLSNSPNIPIGTNLGSGNIVNQNPLFTEYPELADNWAIGQDFTLLEGSPAIGTGTNGIDMGLNSGNAPISNIPRFAKIPGVTSVSIPVSSVPVGGTLQINVSAVSRD